MGHELHLDFVHADDTKPIQYIKPNGRGKGIEQGSKENEGRKVREKRKQTALGIGSGAWKSA